MYVEVRDTLADAVVDADECSLRFHGVLDRARQKLSIRKERSHERAWKINQRFKVRSGNQ